jgi:toxin ParE1/3/4
MMTAEFHPEADEELASAQEWYRQRSEVAAQAFAIEIDKAVRMIIESPERWPVVRAGERRFVLTRFPYSILYRIRSDEVFITAVAHQKRRPGYWKDRR